MTGHVNPSRKELRQRLTDSQSIAVVGASSDPSRPSHGIMKKLLAAGYRVVPVNPNETEVLGQKAYATLAEVPEPVDIVNVQRPLRESTRHAVRDFPSKSWQTR